jgi:hypothetical protein
LEQSSYARDVSRINAGTMGWVRASVGIALMAAPAAPMRLAGDNSPTGAALLLMRTIGIRDLVLGLGTVSAARSTNESDARRWVKATLTSDALDTVVSLAVMRSIGKRDALFAAALAFGFVSADLQSLRTTSERAGQLST